MKSKRKRRRDKMLVSNVCLAATISSRSRDSNQVLANRFRLCLGSSGVRLVRFAMLLLLLVQLNWRIGQQVSGQQSSDFGKDHWTHSKRALESGARPAPSFGAHSEPPALVEYTNSTGAVIQCRAGDSGALPEGRDPQRRAAAGPAAPPPAVSWRVVRKLASGSAQPEELPDEEKEEAVPAGGDPLRWVRADGALVLSPFGANQLRRHLHSATYRCCLSNAFGSLCSRPVRTRAVLEAPLSEIEVYDEFAIAGNSLALSCQAPAHLSKYLQVAGWLKDDKPLVELARRHATASKYLILQTGELYIRNASKLDAGSYKCRVRHRLTNQQAISASSAKLVVDESRTRTELKLTRPNPVVWAHEADPETYLCAHFQSWPLASFSWFKLTQGDARISLNADAAPEMRQLDSCLLIQQVQLHHAGRYLCEATNGNSIKRVSITLAISSRHLSAQLLFGPQPAQVQSSSSVQSSRESARTQLLQLGQAGQLNCSIIGQPYDTIAWFKDGDLLFASSASNSNADDGVRHANGSLIKLVGPNVISIANFRLKDRGVYQCQVYSSEGALGNLSKTVMDTEVLEQSERNKLQVIQQLESVAYRDYLRSASASIQLDVALSAPTISHKFQSQTVQQGAQLALQCSAFGVPAPRIVWMLDNLLIPASDSHQLSSSSGDPAALLDENLELKWDELDIDELMEPSSSHSNEMLGQQQQQHPSKSPILNSQLALIGDERFQISWSQRRPIPAQSVQMTTGSQIIVSELVVGQLTGTESGLYKCLAYNPLGSTQHSGQINVLGGGIQVRKYQARNVTLIAGQAATLQCPLIGYPLARVDWFQAQSNQRLPNNHRQRVEPIKSGAGGQLELANVDKATDGGVYTCRASLSKQNNGTSEDQQLMLDDYDHLLGQLSVSVRVAPLIDAQSLPEVVQANEGMRTKLVCSVVQGDHPVEIRWLKRVHDRSRLAQVGGRRFLGFQLMQNSNGLDSNEDSITIHNLEDSCLLTFKQISHLDAGDYLCLAHNEVSFARRLTRVVVNLAPSWSSEPANEISALLASKLQLDCTAHGNPAPLVTWKRQTNARKLNFNPDPSDQLDGAEFSSVASNYHQRAYANGSLIIDQLDQADAGVYMCEIENGIGVGLSKVVRLKVNVPPHFKLRSASLMAEVSGKVELKCLVYGDQPMIVGWRRDNEIVDLINDSRQRLVSERKLSAQSFESALIMENLVRNDSGQYYCIASNEFGSEETRIQLIVQEAPEQATLLRPIQASSRMATLAFRAPYSGNSPIRKYAIFFKQADSSSNSSAAQQTALNKDLAGWQQVVVDAPPSSADSSSQVLNNSSGNPFVTTDPISSNASFGHLVSLNLCCLQPFTRYLVKVRAINEIGQGEASKAVQFITDEETIGGPPLDVGVEATGAHSLKVRWRAPSQSLQNGFIRGYYIGYRAHSLSASSSGSSNAPDQGRQSTGQSSSNIRVFEVAEGEQYQYKNVQLELNPLSLRSHFASGLMQPQESIGYFQDTLNASANANQPQVFTSYLTNLRRKTTYSIIVQAYNKIGAGPRSDQIMVSTLDAAPPMSPILSIGATSYSSAQLIWSNRKFNNQQESNNSSKVQHRPFELDVSSEETALEDEEEEDPQSFYTINYRTDDRSSSSNNNNDQGWLQRRVQKRQQLPYVLTNLRCGSRHSAFMTATNSLGQSEPGETIKFVTLGAAPVAPTNSHDFLQVNSTYIVLKLSAWQNVGCIISSFILKYKSSNQAKWTIIEHQVHPTLQTVTISGSAVFSSRPLDAAATISLGEQQIEDEWREVGRQQGGFNKRHQVANKHQALNDFVVRNLLIGSTYRVIVEATSEAGETVAEYEFETGNFTSSTIAININGLAASAAPDSASTFNQRSGANGRDSLELGELDFSYSGNQRATNPLQRYTFGVWSLTILFVIASLFMATTTLILGFRSLMRIKSTGSRESLISAMFCCSNSSSSSSSGADSSNSSSGGTCYQVGSEHPLDAYCSLPGHGLIMNNGSQERRLNGAATISGRIDTCDGGELNSIMNDSMPFRQMVSSSSLSTIEGRFNTIAARHGHTIGSTATGCQNRRFSGDEPTPDQHIRAHYAATLGKQNSSFIQGQTQPIKYNTSSPLYGRLQTKFQNVDTTDLNYATNGSNYQQTFHHPQQPTVSSNGTSGYETSNSMRFNLAETPINCQPSCLQRQPAEANYQMNLYGVNGLAIDNNLFDLNNRQQSYDQEVAMRVRQLDCNDQIQNQYLYSDVTNKQNKLNQQLLQANTIEHQQEPQQQVNANYSIAYGTNQQDASIKSGQLDQTQLQLLTNHQLQN